VQVDRARFLARLQQGRHHAHEFPAGIEQHLAACTRGLTVTSPAGCAWAAFGAIQAAKAANPAKISDEERIDPPV
jgi:hypothetical protein